MAVDALALEGVNPDVNWPSVDFITNRNCLRNLLRWISGSRDFRIDTQLVGTQTVLLTRWDKRDFDERHPYHGHNFEKASTVPGPGCSQNNVNLRIVKYVGRC
jgi:hypothetical protein